MSDRLRVVHVLGSLDVGGTELNAVRVMERLDRSVYDLHIVLLSADGPLLSRIEALGAPVKRLRVRGLWRPSTLLRLRDLLSYLRELDPDVVHAHDIYSNILTVPVARAAGVPRVIASRRWWTSTNRLILRPLNALAYRLAHVVLANASSVRALVLAHHRLSPHRVVTVPNFIEDSSFTRPSSDVLDEMRERFGLRRGGPVIGCIANLRAVKGHEVLIDAFAEVVRSIPGVQLVLVGEGSRREAIQRQASDRGVADRVHMVGHQPSRPSPCWIFDVAVLSSHGEGFPNALLEAMACGRPVVATRVGGVPDVVRDGETGRLVARGRADEMSAALIDLLQSPGRVSQLGAAGRRVAEREFSEAIVMGALDELYRSKLC